MLQPDLCVRIEELKVEYLLGINQNSGHENSVKRGTNKQHLYDEKEVVTERRGFLQDLRTCHKNVWSAILE